VNVVVDKCLINGLSYTMKISFGICTHNEFEFYTLFEHLKKFIATRPNYDTEIVVVDDFSTDEGLLAILKLLRAKGEITFVQHALAGDFATHKNFMNSQCTGDWILNLDADEQISFDFLGLLPTLIEANPLVEAYWLPRVNTVHGLTLKHLQKWQWTISTLPGFLTAEMLDPTSEAYELLKQFNLIKSEQHGLVVYDQPIVCWPDPQMRLYKNDPKIQWEGKVHERLIGFANYSMLPTEPEYAILHAKDIARQETQNTFYETIQR
jgi:glycosyltransferase involved in cell wall biosynthesis